MGRIGDRFDALREAGETALVVFLSAGDPDLDTTEALVLAMAEAGADLIEIGVPFSDPTADGPTIQRSSERGLASGASLRVVLELVRRVRDKLDVPLLLMGYANPFYAYAGAQGAEHFAKDAAAVGVDGVIVPDLPPEEGKHFFAALREAGVDPVLLAAPTTTRERMRLLASETRGFLYYVMLTGVTGARETAAEGMMEGIDEGISLARAAADIPVCVGFGVATPDQARALAPHADGVVVGSALVDQIEAAHSPDQAVDAVAKLVEDLKAALREP